jgi:hypothetical protein
MSLIDEVTLLLATDAATYGRYVESILKMEAASEAAKVHISFDALEYHRKLKETQRVGNAR